MLGNDGTYAVKKRKKPVQKIKPQGDGAKSNPSKRHRDRLNGELDRLTGMLPFPEELRSNLDKLSVLRLSVAYLKVKSFFNATMKKNSVVFPTGNGLNTNGLNGVDATSFSEGDLLLQALHGFVLVVTAEGYVFYSSPTIKDYLGFHQSDVVHQSVFELIHTDDRAMFRRQLHFALNPQPFDLEQGGDNMQSSSGITGNIVTYDTQQIPPENSSFLERSFVCRFRCLLDNSSGFLALNFQGRLKYLHGQSTMAEDGTLAQPQLALFTIATPVQPPSIMEIRTKTLLFQTKHKLDFTPLGIDTRGKVVLGYTEMELCMRGTGYQFIHAADMMHCADNHVRMIKTGETGLTVFRLLMKTGGWLWVQANAKLIYKGGRPDFIIVRQRALLNEEGEEYLRKRNQQLPFNCTTGEAVLYETNPSLDVTEFQSNGKAPKIRKVLNEKPLDPDSLLGSMLKQDKSIYVKPPNPQFSVDTVFMDSHALLSVPSDTWQGGMPNGTIKDETTVASMMGALEQMAHDGDLCAALQELDVDGAELKEWENALLRMTKDTNSIDESVSLDEIFTNDIFSYVENALFKESKECNLAQLNFTRKANGNKDPCVGMLKEFSADAGMLNSGLFGGFDCRGALGNGPNTLMTTDPGSVGMVGQVLARTDNAVKNTQRLSHSNPYSAMGLSIPALQQLQLEGILPELSDFANFSQNGVVTFDPRGTGFCAQAQNHKGIGLTDAPSTSSFNQPNGWGLCPQKQIQDSSKGTTDQVTIRNQMISHQCQPHPAKQTENTPVTRLHNCLNQSNQLAVDQLSNVAPNHGNHFVPPIPETDFIASQMEHCIPNVSNPSHNPYPQGCAPFNAPTNQTHHLGQWPQNQPQQFIPNAIQNRLTPDGYSQTSETQRIPLVSLWPQNSQDCQSECRPLNLVNGIYHSPQGGLANNQTSPPSSCMYETCSPSKTNGDHLHGPGQAVTIPSCWKKMPPNKQSPPQASCYFQRGFNEPVVGTSSISQEDACHPSASHPSCQLVPGISSHENPMVMQYLLDSNGQTQIQSHPVEDNGSFSLPSLVNGTMHFSEHNQANCFNF